MLFGVYVHYPYCSRLCPYCDFNVAVTPEIPHRRYRDAVLAELETRAPEFSDRGPAVSVYFGGGTPGLWPAEHIGAVIDTVERRQGLREGAEITVECNPEDITIERLQSLRAAGVNRLSLGIQSFDDTILEGLGRAHDSAMIQTAVEAVERAGFVSFSVDLIHGLAGQTLASAVADVELACALGAPHISTYQLTIEPSTHFGRRTARGETLVVDEDRLFTFYESIRAALHRGGVEPYEVSNAARPGFEAIHNRLYWTGGAYLGLGAGAHGLWRGEHGGRRWENDRHPSRYMTKALSGRVCDRETIAIDAATWLEERLFTGLRLDCGIEVDDQLSARFGAAVARQIAGGFLVSEGGHWRLTPRGRAILDRVVLALIADG